MDGSETPVEDQVRLYADSIDPAVGDVVRIAPDAASRPGPRGMRVLAAVAAVALVVLGAVVIFGRTTDPATTVVTDRDVAEPAAEDVETVDPVVPEIDATGPAASEVETSDQESAPVARPTGPPADVAETDIDELGCARSSVVDRSGVFEQPFGWASQNSNQPPIYGRFEGSGPVSAVEQYLESALPDWRRLGFAIAAGDAEGEVKFVDQQLEVGNAVVVAGDGGFFVERVNSNALSMDLRSVADGLRGIVTSQEPGEVTIELLRIEPSSSPQPGPAVAVWSETVAVSPAPTLVEAGVIEQELRATLRAADGSLAGFVAYNPRQGIWPIGPEELEGGGFDTDREMTIDYVVSEVSAQLPLLDSLRERLLASTEIVDWRTWTRWSSLSLLDVTVDRTAAFACPNEVITAIVMRPGADRRGILGDLLAAELITGTVMSVTPFVETVVPGPPPDGPFVVDELPAVDPCSMFSLFAPNRFEGASSEVFATATDAANGYSRRVSLTDTQLSTFVDDEWTILGFAWSSGSTPYDFAEVIGVEPVDGGWRISGAEWVGC